MRLPRDLSGRELVAVLCRHWGYRFDHQRGSHIVLATDVPSSFSITVPDHASLRIGTLNAILRAVAQQKGVTKEEIATSLV